jgi:hypothetical protein
VRTIRTDRLTRTVRGRTYTLTIEATVVPVDGAEQPVGYVVATSSGYRVAIPACRCGRADCLKQSGHLVKGGKGARQRHEDGYCHGWHWGRVRALADAVLATYGRGATTGTARSIAPDASRQAARA